jgi:uncharacterized membrane protein
MTETSYPAKTLLARIQVSANCSLSRREAILFFGIVAVATLCVAGFFAAQGMWPILPFAGLELFVLGVALGVSLRRGDEFELITVISNKIVVERHGHRGIDSREFSRVWARVELRPSARRGHPSLLVIRSHDREMEIGRHLTEGARRDLHRRLVDLIGGIGEAPENEPALQEYEKLPGNGVGIDVQQNV